MLDLFVFDSVIFFAGLLVSVIILWHRTKQFPGLRPFGLLYVAGTLSSYNIMVKPVHDYNLVIPRTLLTHGKIAGPLSVLDGLMILTLLCVLLWPGARKDRGLRIPREFRLILFKDLALAAISLALFLMLMTQTTSPFGGELAWYRQIIYYLALFFLVARFQKRNPDADLIQVFTTFVWIDVINFLSGFLSTLVYSDVVWQRYLLNVTIIDQDDVMIAIMYPLLLVSMWVWKSTFLMSKAIIGFALAITLLLLANFYKGSIAYIVLFLPFLVLYAMAKKRSMTRPLFATLAIIPVGVLFYWIFFVLYSAAPLETRENQLSDLTSFMSSLSVVYPVIGIGNGTLYDRNDTEDDLGETKAIDKDDNPNKASVMQSPGAQIYKATGLPGIAIHLAAMLFACSLMIRKVIAPHPIAVAAGYLICMQFALNFVFLDPTGMVAFVIVKLSLFTTLARRQMPARS